MAALTVRVAAIAAAKAGVHAMKHGHAMGVLLGRAEGGAVVAIEDAAPLFHAAAPPLAPLLEAALQAVSDERRGEDAARQIVGVYTSATPPSEHSSSSTATTTAVDASVALVAERIGANCGAAPFVAVFFCGRRTKRDSAEEKAAATTAAEEEAVVVPQGFVGNKKTPQQQWQWQRCGIAVETEAATKKQQQRSWRKLGRLLTDFEDLLLLSASATEKASPQQRATDLHNRAFEAAFRGETTIG